MSPLEHVLISCNYHQSISNTTNQKNAAANFSFAGDLKRKALKQNWRNSKHKLASDSRLRWKFQCKVSNASTYSSRIATDIYLYETPNASFDQYLEDKPRVFKAIFPDKRRSQQLNDEEWRVHMLPIQFLFLTCNPVIDMRLRCKKNGHNYPTGVPPQVSKVLDLDIIRWELHGIEDIVKPSEFSLGVKGALYPYRQGNLSKLKGQLIMSITFDLPPVLGLIPEDVRRDVAETTPRMDEPFGVPQLLGRGFLSPSIRVVVQEWICYSRARHMAKKMLQNFKTISEIVSMGWTPGITDEVFTVIARVHGIDDEPGWNYATCNNCSKM